jgi:hypothetical protein
MGAKSTWKNYENKKQKAARSYPCRTATHANLLKRNDNEMSRVIIIKVPKAQRDKKMFERQIICV